MINLTYVFFQYDHIHIVVCYYLILFIKNSKEKTMLVTVHETKLENITEYSTYIPEISIVSDEAFGLYSKNKFLIIGMRESVEKIKDDFIRLSNQNIHNIVCVYTDDMFENISNLNYDEYKLKVRPLFRRNNYENSLVKIRVKYNYNMFFNNGVVLPFTFQDTSVYSSDTEKKIEDFFKSNLLDIDELKHNILARVNDPPGYSDSGKLSSFKKLSGWQAKLAIKFELNLSDISINPYKINSIFTIANKEILESNEFFNFWTETVKLFEKIKNTPFKLTISNIKLAIKCRVSVRPRNGMSMIINDYSFSFGNNMKCLENIQEFYRLYNVESHDIVINKMKEKMLNAI